MLSPPFLLLFFSFFGDDIAFSLNYIRCRGEIEYVWVYVRLDELLLRLRIVPHIEHMASVKKSATVTRHDDL